MPGDRFYEDDYHLAPFRIGETAADHVFTGIWVDQLPVPSGILVASTAAFQIYQEEDKQTRYLGFCEKGWEHASMCVVHQGKQHDIFMKNESYPDKVSINILLEAMAAEHIIARNHGFIFHCSYISYNGKAILFTAPSQTGKSTQAELWRRYRNAEIINGDRAVVRMMNGELLAEGIPFAGSSEYCKKRSLPIEAIVYLGQAPVTTIRKTRGYEAFSKIWEGISVNMWDKTDMEQVSAVVQKVAQKIPVFHMPCTPDETAVNVLESAMRK